MLLKTIQEVFEEEWAYNPDDEVSIPGGIPDADIGDATGKKAIHT